MRHLALVFGLSIAITTSAFAFPQAEQLCAARAEKMTQNVQSDIKKRQIAESVGQKLLKEINDAETLCRKNETGKGTAILDKISKTYGYH